MSQNATQISHIDDALVQIENSPVDFDQPQEVKIQQKFINDIFIAEPTDPNVIAIMGTEVFSTYNDAEYMYTPATRYELDHSTAATTSYQGKRYIRKAHAHVDSAILYDSDSVELVKSNDIISIVKQLSNGSQTYLNALANIILAFGNDMEKSVSALEQRHVTLKSMAEQIISLSEQLSSFKLNSEHVFALRAKGRDRNFVTSHVFGARMIQKETGTYGLPNVGGSTFQRKEQLPKQIKFSEAELSDFYFSSIYNDVKVCQQIGRNLMVISLEEDDPVPDFWTLIGFYLYTAGCGLKPALELFAYRLKNNDKYLFSLTASMMRDAFYKTADKSTFVFSIRSALLNGAPSTFTRRLVAKPTRVEEYVGSLSSALDLFTV